MINAWFFDWHDFESKTNENLAKHNVIQSKVRLPIQAYYTEMHRWVRPRAIKDAQYVDEHAGREDHCMIRVMCVLVSMLH